jgi:hypothetical protein
VSSDNKLPATGVGGIPSPFQPQVDGTLPALGIHVTYWWQILALMEFEAEMERLEPLLVWANVELRNDE